jgi:hypothetical protein
MRILALCFIGLPPVFAFAWSVAPMPQSGHITVIPQPFFVGPGDKF